MSLATRTLQNAETSLQDREQAIYDNSRRIYDAGQARDQAARQLELLHGSRPATSAATLPEDGRGILDVDLSDITGKSSWQTP